jgi:hypothetical protein
MYCIQCGEQSLSGQGPCKKCGALLPPESIEEKPYKVLQFLSQPLPFFIILLLITAAISSFMVWRHLSVNRDDPTDTVRAFYTAIEQQDADSALQYMTSDQQDDFSRSLTFLTASDQVTFEFQDIRYKIQGDYKEGANESEVRVSGTIVVSIGEQQQEDSFRDDVLLVTEDGEWKIKTSDIAEIIVL